MQRHKNICYFDINICYFNPNICFVNANFTFFEHEDTSIYNPPPLYKLMSRHLLKISVWGISWFLQGSLRRGGFHFSKDNGVIISCHWLVPGTIQNTRIQQGCPCHCAHTVSISAHERIIWGVAWAILSACPKGFVCVCWLVLRLERAVSNTKAYQSLLDGPSLPRNLITRNQHRLMYTQYTTISYPPYILIPIQKKEQKPKWIIIYLTQMCHWHSGPWAVSITIGMVPLLLLCSPCLHLSRIRWVLPSTPLLSAIGYQYTPLLFSSHTPVAHPPTVDRSTLSIASALARASLQSGWQHKCGIPQDARKQSGREPKFCCNIGGWPVLLTCRKWWQHEVRHCHSEGPV